MFTVTLLCLFMLKLVARKHLKCFAYSVGVQIALKRICFDSLKVKQIIENHLKVVQFNFVAGQNISQKVEYLFWRQKDKSSNLFVLKLI